MTERQNEGAGFGAQGGAMEWRLETLHRRTEEGVRKLGARILEMYHQGEVDPAVVRRYAVKLDELEHSATELEEAMQGQTGPRQDPAPSEPAPRRPVAEPRRERRPAGRPLRPLPALRPVMGAEDSPPAEQQAAAEPPSNGESDDRMKQAVDAARRQAEERATAEILALEQDLEREREKAAESLAEVQRRLEEAEAGSSGEVSVTDARAREEAATWLREQRGDVRRELEAELERRMLAREEELVAERDKAEAQLKDALQRLERAESSGTDAQEERAEA
jgi:hypothetical protein